MYSRGFFILKFVGNLVSLGPLVQLSLLGPLVGKTFSNKTLFLAIKVNLLNV
jgi:hypothetical protein